MLIWFDLNSQLYTKFPCIVYNVRAHSAEPQNSTDSMRLAVFFRFPADPRHRGSAGGAGALLPHGVFVTGHSAVKQQGRDLEILTGSGATIVHCPLVMARYGAAMESFARFRKLGIPVAMGTDTFPPDVIENMRTGINLCRVLEQDEAACSAAAFYSAATVFGANASLMGRVVMRDHEIPGVALDEYQDRAQAQFDGLRAKYPERTWHHPPLEQIFPPSFPYA